VDENGCADRSTTLISVTAVFFPGETFRWVACDGGREQGIGAGETTVVVIFHGAEASAWVALQPNKDVIDSCGYRKPAAGLLPRLRNLSLALLRRRQCGRRHADSLGLSDGARAGPADDPGTQKPAQNEKHGAADRRADPDMAIARSGRTLQRHGTSRRSGEHADRSRSAKNVKPEQSAGSPAQRFISTDADVFQIGFPIRSAVIEYVPQ